MSLLTYVLTGVNWFSQSKKLKYVSQQTIKKSSDMKHKLEDVIMGGSSARNEFLIRRKQSSSALSNSSKFSCIVSWHTNFRL